MASWIDGGQGGARQDAMIPLITCTGVIGIRARKTSHWPTAITATKKVSNPTSGLEGHDHRAGSTLSVTVAAQWDYTLGRCRVQTACSSNPGSKHPA